MKIINKRPSNKLLIFFLASGQVGLVKRIRPVVVTVIFQVPYSTGAPKLMYSDLFLEKRATVPIKTQGVQRSSSGKMSTF